MTIVSQLPELMVWFAGLVLALMNWRRTPRAAPLLLLAMVTLITLRLVTGYVNGLLPALMSGPQLSDALALSNFAQSAIAAVAWGMVLVAVFGGRQRGRGE